MTRGFPARRTPAGSGRYGLVIGIAAVLAAASMVLVAVRWPASTEPATGALGAGLAFRCADAADCWTVSVIPQFETVSIFRSVGGTRRLVRNLGPIGASGTTTVTVRLSGRRMSFSLDGEQRVVLDDATLVDQRGAGLTALDVTDLAVGRWTDFTVMGPAGDVRTEPLRRAAPTPLDTITTPFRWTGVSGRWTAGTDGARLRAHGGTPIDLALVGDVAQDSTISVTLTGIR